MTEVLQPNVHDDSNIDTITMQNSTFRCIRYAAKTWLVTAAASYLRLIVI